MVLSFPKALVNGLFCAVLGVIAGLPPHGTSVEEELGLDWLYKLRGQAQPPPEVVVISVDGDSRRELGLPRKLEEWPRAVHAGLVERLTAAGSAAVGFDVLFAERRHRDPAGDRRLAEAISAAGNVVLLQFLERNSEPSDDGVAGGNEPDDQLRSPLPQLVEAAAALAPFPLPKVPAKVKQAWLFKKISGEVPTLPAVMFQLYVMDHYEALVLLIRGADPEFAASLPASRDEALGAGRLEDLVSTLRMRMRGDTALGARLLEVLDSRSPARDEPAREMLRSVILMYVGRHDPYVNYYGPARTVTTLPYHEVLSASAERLSGELRGKAVFVGTSADAQPGQRDGFYTPFTSETTGLDISGVEIAATTFANLVDRRPVTQLVTGMTLLIIFVWGMIAGVVARLFATPIAVGGTLALAGAYALWAYLGFARAGFWYPLAIPLLLQTPVALLTAFVWRYVDSIREQRKMKKAFEHYLPPEVVEKVARDITSITGENREMYGVCLYTDVEKFTSLSELMAPAELGVLMNRYFETMIRPVREHGGMVSNLAGDAMLATWASEAAEPGNRRRACTAALAIREAVGQLNETLGERKLPTRIGLHAGQLLLGNIGAMDHYEYSVLGDMVNTAARIQAVNRHLGTRVLASEQVIEGVDGLVTRELGCFLLAGKHSPVTLHELVAEDGGSDPVMLEGIAHFEQALHAYRRRDWERALRMFEDLLNSQPGDSTVRLYLGQCRRLIAQAPDPEWSGVITIDTK